MARMNARALRRCARSAVLAAGGRGFVRFAPPGGALLLTDALRRMEDDTQAQRLLGALEAAGFRFEERGGLLLLTPEDALLRDGRMDIPCVQWDSHAHAAQALAVRWIAHAPQPLTAAGRQLILETLRQTGFPAASGLGDLRMLRARAAAMMRTGDMSGLNEAGWILYDECGEESE